MRPLSLFPLIIAGTITALAGSPLLAQTGQAHSDGSHHHDSRAGKSDNYRSRYVGQEQRQIKSLSAEDIKELKRGGGWGLAKAAELNGMPGPAHILEMAAEIQLGPEQQNRIQQLYNEMKAAAVVLGERLITLEADLNTAFADASINQARLEQSVREIESIRADLRIVHLSTHLQTPDILTREQIDLYNRLRGYASDPCQNIPQGHDPEMWKRHNNCA